MAVYPVIMCGGAGVRLWPASRPDRPKPFTRLTGDLSSFQETVLRVAPLGQCVVVGGIAHRALIVRQLAEIGVEAEVLLEPAPRDSAAAMAAAAAHILAVDREGVMAVVAADHHVPDAEAFRAAVGVAVTAARVGRIVTLGVRPASPSTAYGYIRPAAGQGVRLVEAFVEKPDAARAAEYMAQGYLWNSGNFVVPAELLARELSMHAPQVLAAARAGVEQARSEDGAVVLGPAFLAAPKISIDYAVMEKTGRAAVLPVDFEWSDLGAWDAVLVASARDADGNSVSGEAVARDCEGSLIHAGPGTQVIAIGLRDMAVVADGGQVLVCDLEASQSVKGGVEALKARGPSGFASLTEASAWYDRWIRTSALPLWWSLGADHARGGFHEALSVEGEPRPAPRRGRLQGRMVFTFAEAGAMGWQGPWRQAAWHGADYMLDRFVRPDGLIRTLVSEDGEPLDETAAVYDQAFALLGMASLHAVDPGRRDLPAAANRLRQGLEGLRHPQGGFREAGSHPFQANCHMHLFEAALAWEEAGEASWASLSDEIAQLALGAFIDHRGVLSEFFDADWNRAAGDDGRLVEPGHQFEWAWLLDRWGRRRGRADGQIAARALYDAGRRGIDPVRGCAVNALWDDFSPRDDMARLWPQTEHLKAALILGEDDEALGAANCLKSYLETPATGAWRDKLRSDGTFVDEAAPGTSFYHIICACRILFADSPARLR
ncbi:MAG TPA: AGE family epimerase/isomerase [Phenylobacterium sp.]|nr:AGE family epimerase/isomerase [Phenylobacterium sp.]